jgi:AcrR family transcriptional regulator
MDLSTTYKTAWRLHRVIRPRLPRDIQFSGSWSREEALHVFAAVLSDGSSDMASIAIHGRRARRRSRAQQRMLALGSGRLVAREPQEERILRSACAVLVRRGYAAARMKDIAAEAQVSLAALYNIFENKEDLLLSAIDWANYQGTLEREEIIARNCSATQKLSSFLNLAVLSGQIREEHALYLDLWSRVGGEESLRPMVVRARERWHRYFGEIIAEGVASGEFHLGADIDDVVAVIVALQTGIGVETIVQFDWMSEARARELLAAFVARELEIRPSDLSLHTPS